MFDPTAFDNMKVVVEGALYDLDLDGIIKIIDRNDLVNLAKMSRKYEISYTYNMSPIKCTVEMEGKLANFAAELLDTVKANLVGVEIVLRFELEHKNDEQIFQQIQEKTEKIWGKERTIEQRITANPFQQKQHITNSISIYFNRLILEDQIDDLIHMLEYIEKTNEQLLEIYK